MSSQQLPPFHPSAAARPAAHSSGPGALVKLIAVLFAAGAGAGAGFAAHSFVPPFPPLAEEPVPAAEASAPPVASAPSASSPSVPAPSAATPPPIDPLACMRPLFPDKTFPTDKTPLEFVCDERNPVKGGPRVRATLVEVSGKATSPGMKEWAVLGFYELAAFAVLRGRCCAPASPLELPASPADCDSMQTALEGIAAAAEPEAKQETVDKALESYSKAVKCVVRNKMSKVFGEYSPPAGGEATAFKKVLARARGDQPPKPK